MRVYAQTYASSPDLFDGYTSGELHQNAQDAESEVDDSWEPSVFELITYVEAAEAYREYARYGMPYEGAIRDQPHAWRLAVDCAQDAQDHARSDASMQARRESQHSYEE